MNIYKGFIPSDGKVPKSKIINGDLLTYEQVTSTIGDFVGVLHDDYVMVDFDDPEEAEKIQDIVEKEGINCNIIKTSRGCHCYFKNTTIDTNKIHTKTPIGLTVDIKLGTKNTVDPLRIEGVDRIWIKTVEECDPIPFWLLPMTGGKDLSKSDTRNNDLYTYILPLQGQGFNKDQIKEIVRIINTYILDTPLDTRELDVVIRDEAFTKPVFFVKGKFQHDVFSEYLIRNDNVVKIDNVLYSYQNGKYDSEFIERSMIKHISKLTKTQRREVLYYLELTAPEIEQSPSYYISVLNGVLDLRNMQMLDHSSDIVIANMIPYKYREDSYCAATDRTLNKIACGSKEVRLLLEEVVGFCLFRRNELGKFFILTGSGSNGKSTFLNMIKKLLGRSNISNLSLHEVGEKFKTAQLVGKLANIGDDISNRYIDENDIFKKLVTGESVNVERKGLDPFDFTGYAKFLFACNTLPRVSDTTDGFMRRMEIVPFDAKFSPQDKDYDPYIADKLMSNESIEYLLKLAIDGLLRVIKNNGFTKTDVGTAAKTDYESINNPIIQFVNDGHKIINENRQDVYRVYSIWCLDNGLKPVSNVVFGRELANKFGFKVKRVRREDKLIWMYE